MLPFIAPLLKAGLGLVANAALAKGKDFIEQKTGVKLQPEMSSEDLLKLKQFELEHETELLKIKQEDNRIDLQRDQMFIGDMQNARARDVEFLKAGRHNTRGDVLAYASIGALILCAFLAFFVDLTQAQERTVFTLLGVFSTITVIVYQFEFGASKAGEKAADRIQKMWDES